MRRRNFMKKEKSNEGEYKNETKKCAVDIGRDKESLIPVGDHGNINQEGSFEESECRIERTYWRSCKSMSRIVSWGSGSS